VVAAAAWAAASVILAAWAAPPAAAAWDAGSPAGCRRRLGFPAREAARYRRRFRACPRSRHQGRTVDSPAVCLHVCPPPPPVVVFCDLAYVINATSTHTHTGCFG
jgi:hypothetical protein